VCFVLILPQQIDGSYRISQVDYHCFKKKAGKKKKGMCGIKEGISEEGKKAIKKGII